MFEHLLKQLLITYKQSEVQYIYIYIAPVDKYKTEYVAMQGLNSFLATTFNESFISHTHT